MNMKDNEYIELKTQPEVRKLSQYGFIEAGKTGGSELAFKTYLDRIVSGNLLDESVFKGKSPEEVKNINNQIESIETSVVEKKNEIETLKDKVKGNDGKIENFENLREQYLTGIVNQNGVSHLIDVFNPTKFWISSFFLIMLSLFIFLFYVAVVYKAFFVDTQDIINAIKNNDWGVSLLPEWKEVQIAVQNNLMVIFAPFVFFGFGYAIHILLEGKSMLKYVGIALVIAVTFLLDYLLADQIHQRAVEALSFIGEEDRANEFSDILIVIIMGFVVYIIWSIIFHYWMNELDKRNIPDRLGKQIKRISDTNEELSVSISNCKKSIGVNENRISQLKKSITNIVVPTIEIVKSISEFTSGWYRFLTGLEDNNSIRLCNEQLEDFKKRHDLEDGQIYKNLGGNE